MSFVEHLGGYFSEFGEVAIWKDLHSVDVIFDNQFNLSNGVVESNAPAIMVEAAKVQGIAHGQNFEIRLVQYKVVGIEPDTTGGLLFVKLEKQ
jgi:hypothetical protein